MHSKQTLFNQTSCIAAIHGLSVRSVIFVEKRNKESNSILSDLAMNIVEERSYTHYDPRKTGQNFRIEQTLVSRVNTCKK